MLEMFSTPLPVVGYLEIPFSWSNDAKHLIQIQGHLNFLPATFEKKSCQLPKLSSWSMDLCKVPRVTVRNMKA